MVNTGRGVIDLELDWSQESKRIESEPKKIGNFVWTATLVSNQTNERCALDGNVALTCKPENEVINGFYSCDVHASVTVFGQDSDNNTRSEWSSRFHKRAPLCKCSFIDQLRSSMFFRSTEEQIMKVSVEINIVRSYLIDLSSPDNTAILSPSDAAKFKIGEDVLWLSKSILSTHSPVFAAMFRGNFKENEEELYELHDIDTNQFIRFLSFLYPVITDLQDTAAASYLLKLADMYECDAVIYRCEQLLNSKVFNISDDLDRLKISDRYSLISFRPSAISALPLEVIKTQARTKRIFSFSEFTLERLNERLCSNS